MKKILLALFLFLQIAIEANSQVKFDTCSYISKFEGTWQYNNGTDTIKVYLRANRSYYPDFNSISDRLYGWHEYKQGNVVIESTWQNRFMSLANADTITRNSSSILLGMGTGADCSDTARWAMGKITDYLQGKEAKIVTVTLNASGNLMTWQQRHSATIALVTGPIGMTLPREFILVKQP